MAAGYILLYIGPGRGDVYVRKSDTRAGIASTENQRKRKIVAYNFDDVFNLMS